MVNIVTPPMSPIHENWMSDDEDFDAFNNTNGVNLLPEFDMVEFEEDQPLLFEDLIIPDLQRSDNMHEIDPLDEDNMPAEPPRLYRQNALPHVVQNVTHEPVNNIIVYYPDPLDIV